MGQKPNEIFFHNGTVCGGHFYYGILEKSQRKRHFAIFSPRGGGGAVLSQIKHITYVVFRLNNNCPEKMVLQLTRAEIRFFHIEISDVA